MSIPEYLRFYSELGVTHLNVNGARKRSPRRPLASLEAQGVTAGPPPLDSIREDIGDCRRCRLSEGRHTIVFGVGNPKAELMFVGEAPGEDEDAQGLPFVGKAGQLLTRIIEAIDLKREDVYIANVIKCRPPNNRSPLPDEIEACRDFVFRQIESVHPLIIVALGRHAMQTLLRTEASITHVRGKFFDYHGTPLIPTFHPSYLLRNPSAKREVWEDMKAVRARLKELDSGYYR
jgi:uracil-DNA glycosylase family 4